MVDTAAWNRSPVLRGERVLLEPLDERHILGLLAAAADPATWTWLFARLDTEAALRAWLADALRARDAGTEIPFATLDARTGRVVGSTRYLAIVPAHRRLEIGWTWLTPATWGTGINIEAKQLMLAHAFDELGAMRVELKTDARNERSRAAILALGARFEGVFCKHMRMADGRIRDSAWYSITDDDWPAVRQRLQARLAASRGPAGGIATSSGALPDPPADVGRAPDPSWRGGQEVTTVDYHAGGEPFRIVTGGVPEIPGATVLEKRRWAAANLDHVRRLLVNEPRGHADMYGCFVVQPNDAAADLGVIFFHNEGYSTACGHGTIALVTWALESGRLPIRGQETAVTVDVPSGRLACVARCDVEAQRDVVSRRVLGVRFRNVPSFVLAEAVTVATSAGPVRADVAYGGAFYGSVDVRSLGLSVDTASLPRLIALQRELRPALDAALDVAHPEQPELHGIYGIIFWQDEPTAPGTGPALTQRNVTVFADGEVDRSPCGSGTSARLAILHAQGRLRTGEELRHLSIVDSVFTGRVVGMLVTAGLPSVVTEVEGRAHPTGRHAFVLDPADPLGTGFLLR
jgi:proline racemase/RimJ/RimL family protein N-acetyltransferase